MKKFVKKIFIFILCLSFLLYVYCEISQVAAIKYNGENTEQQIEKSFQNAVKEEYNCYFLGNSRIYRDINPDRFSDVNAYNFAHDNDSYNQMYYKLLYLEKEGIEFDYLIIGTDYFQFSFLGDSRNYIYDRWFSIEYIKDYNSSILDEIFSDILFFWKTKRESVKFCIPYLMGKPAGEHINYLKDNGQYIAYGEAGKDDTIDRNCNILEVQKQYLEKIIHYCNEKNITFYVVMPPTRDEELASYTQDELIVFHKMLREVLDENYEKCYIDCSNLKEFKHYSNYTDITHLNEEAANRFSIYLSEELHLVE